MGTCRASASACPKTGEITGRQECPPYNSRNARASASVRGEEEDNRSNDNAKNAEEGINPSVEWRGVRIGFGWHGI